MKSESQLASRLFAGIAAVSAIAFVVALASGKAAWIGPALTSCFREPWPVDAARERLRKQLVNAGPIHTAFPEASATTKAIALTPEIPENSRDTSSESIFISQPPDQCGQCRTVAD